MDKRTRARELTMQAVFQLDVQGDGFFDNLNDFLVVSEPDDGIRTLAVKWIKGAWQQVKLCDELIAGACIKWSLSRLSPVDKSILRMSVYHLQSCPDIPPKVVIDEAIELAKKFSTEQSPGFVNGVLDAIKRKLENKEGKQLQ
ncbi:MAG: transcription antitermination factor NusB [Sedimentisphaerales bacterium]|nr:transcription antitermination factor NusB [Sedimentisphaerales bacterium]